MKLTKNNYFSQAAEMEYITYSQLKAFAKCESQALAAINGEGCFPTSQALAVGSYIDAAFDGPKALELHKTEHPEIYKRDGTLKAEYANAQVVVDRMRADKLLRMLTTGRHQTIVTGKIAGEPVKGKIDVLLDEKAVRRITEEFPETCSMFRFAEGAIIDVKSAKDLNDVWSAEDRMYLPWAEAWQYDWQGAVYQELYRQQTGKQLPFILAVGTKENPPSIRAFNVSQQDLNAALNILEEMIPHIAAVKRGEEKPNACGHCAWCRSQRKLTSIIDWRSTSVR